MAKSLSERIADRVKRKKPSRNAQNRAIFLALRPDIKMALADEWSVKIIWETLHEEGKVNFSYQSFRGYVNRLILIAPSPNATNDLATTPQPPASPESREPNKKPDAAIPGFTFQANPNKGDLF